MTFFEDQGKWRFVTSNSPSRFPADALRAVANAQEAKPDTLGKLTLK